MSLSEKITVSIQLLAGSSQLFLDYAAKKMYESNKLLSKVYHLFLCRTFNSS